MADGLFLDLSGPVIPSGPQKRETFMTKTVDVEKLLQWAFCEELPKGRPVSASPWDAITNFASLGVRVDTGGWRDGLGFVHGAPDPDAEKAGAAVAALARDHKLGEARVLALAEPYGGLDPLAARQTGGAPASLAALTIRCAILGRRMEWDVGVPRLRAVTRDDNQWPIVFGLDGEGQLTVLRADRRGRYPLDRSPRTHLEWVEPSPAQVIEARAEYAAWHDALLCVAAALAGTLTGFDAVTVAAPPAPWHTGEAAAPPVLLSQRAVSKRALLLQPKRAAALPPVESDIARAARRSRNRRLVSLSALPQLEN